MFELTYSDVSSIKDKGVGRAYYIGELKDFIDLDVEDDVAFAKWYWGEEDYLTKISAKNNKTE